MAAKTLQKAITMLRTAYGPEDIRLARAYELLGKFCTMRQEFDKALDHLSQAWEIRERCFGIDTDGTLTLWCDMAWIHYLAGDLDEAIALQESVVDKVFKLNKFPALAVDSAMRLAKFKSHLSESGKGDANGMLAALKILETAEKVSCEGLGSQHLKTLEVKRGIAMLFIKQRDYEKALQHLNDIQYLLCQSSS